MHTVSRASAPTQRRPLALLALLAVVFSTMVASTTMAAEKRPPNIIIIFTDDQGYADVGVFGAKGFETPNLDRMAREGRMFTHWYAAQPVCSASRAGLLTGCYPNRIGIHGALGPNNTHGLSDKEMTIAEVCKQKGYATAAYGKWHLGHHKQFLPVHHGFDDYFGLPYSNDMWPFHPTAGARFPDLPLIEDDKVVKAKVTGEDQKLITAWYTGRAVEFIDKNKNKPFFLYVPHSMPHVPLYVSGKFKGSSEQGLYGDVIQEIDWSVGEILKAVKRNGLDENTLVIYTSDNGPWVSYGDHSGSALPLREAKGTAWEGGVREPTIMRWPGRVPAGTVCDTPAMNIDLLPTVAHLVGAKLPKHKIDGRNVWPLIAGEKGAKNPHEGYWFYYKQNELHAVTMGKWKLYLPHTYRTMGSTAGGTGGTPTRYLSAKVTKPELYNLADDMSETVDLAAKYPEVVKRLERFAEKARAELGDRLTKRKGSGVRAPGQVAEAPQPKKPAPGNTKPKGKGKPVAKKTTTPEGLKPGEYAIKKEAGLVYVTGEIHNQSAHDQKSIQVQFDLFDKQGKRLGETSDFIGNLTADATWTFRCLVLQKDAATVKFARIERR